MSWYNTLSHDNLVLNIVCLSQVPNSALVARKQYRQYVNWVSVPQKPSDQIRSDQSLSRVRLFVTPWIAACQASLSITNSRSSLRLTSIESVMHPAISSSVVPFSSCPQSLPASESFPMTQLFAWGGYPAGIHHLIIQIISREFDRLEHRWQSN